MNVVVSHVAFDAQPTPNAGVCITLIANDPQELTPETASIEADGPLVMLAAVAPSDILYVPMAAVVVEKSLNADSIAWRVPVTTLGSSSVMRGFLMLKPMLDPAVHDLALVML